MKTSNLKPIARKSLVFRPIIGANPAAVGERKITIRAYVPKTVLRLPERPAAR